MDFNLTEQHQMMQTLFREVAETVVKDNAADVDEQERFPKENVEAMRQAKMLGIPYPREYGGAGADYLSASWRLRLAKKCCTASTVLSARASLVAPRPIAAFGADEQKAKYLATFAG